MVRSVTPFVHVMIPAWLNRKLVEEYAEAHGLTLDEARDKLFKEKNG